MYLFGGQFRKYIFVQIDSKFYSPKSVQSNRNWTMIGLIWTDSDRLSSKSVKYGCQDLEFDMQEIMNVRTIAFSEITSKITEILPSQRSRYQD